MSRTREEYDNLIELFDTIKELEAEKKELIEILNKISNAECSDYVFDLANDAVNKFKEEI